MHQPTPAEIEQFAIGLLQNRHPYPDTPTLLVDDVVMQRAEPYELRCEEANGMTRWIVIEG